MILCGPSMHANLFRCWDGWTGPSAREPGRLVHPLEHGQRHNCAVALPVWPAVRKLHRARPGVRFPISIGSDLRHRYVATVVFY